MTLVEPKGTCPSMGWHARDSWLVPAGVKKKGEMHEREFESAIELSAR